MRVWFYKDEPQNKAETIEAIYCIYISESDLHISNRTYTICFTGGGMKTAKSKAKSSTLTVN